MNFFLFGVEGASTKGKRPLDRKPNVNHGKPIFQLLSRAIQKTPNIKSLLLLWGAHGCSPEMEVKSHLLKILYT